MVTTRPDGGKCARTDLDRLGVVFDDRRAVANAGLVLPATLAGRLGVEALGDRLIDLGRRPGAARPGRKLMTLVHAMLAGADSIDDAGILRTGATASVLGHRVMAPSTLGTFLRAFTFGHVRQLDRLGEQVLARAWAAGAGPGQAALTIDVDSTVCEVHGYQKQGAGFGHTRVRGYHPLLATRADTGEVLHVRMRKGSANTMRGAERFVNELAGRVRRAGARGPLTLRADSGFWASKVIDACRRHQIRFSISVRTGDARIAAAIARIPEGEWQAIDYPPGGEAQVAEVDLPGPAAGGAPHAPGGRPGRALSRLAPSRLPHRPPRPDASPRGRPPPARRCASWPSATSRPRPCATAPRAASSPTRPGR